MAIRVLGWQMAGQPFIGMRPGSSQEGHWCTMCLAYHAECNLAGAVVPQQAEEGGHWLPLPHGSPLHGRRCMQIRGQRTQNCTSRLPAPLKLTAARCMRLPARLRPLHRRTFISKSHAGHSLHKQRQNKIAHLQYNPRQKSVTRHVMRSTPQPSGMETPGSALEHFVITGICKY